MTKQPNPTPIRIPEDWKPEIQAAAAKRIPPLTPHAYVLKALRRVLDGEYSAGPVRAASPQGRAKPKPAVSKKRPPEEPWNNLKKEKS